MRGKKVIANTPTPATFKTVRLDTSIAKELYQKEQESKRVKE